MSSWKLAPCLEVLRNQINAAWPNRPNKADGTIGDQAHASRKSDHNPDSKGIVRAIDITKLHCTDELIHSIKDDPRVKYIIWESRIYYPGTGWKPYSGANAHDKHFHVSVNDNFNSDKPWSITSQKEVTMAKLDDEDRKWLKAQFDNVVEVVVGNTGPNDNDGAHVSNADLLREIRKTKA